jgi:DUF1009 family protein
MEKIGIVCGSGKYPHMIAKACVDQSREFCLLFLNGFCDAQNWPDVPQLSVNIGEIGKALEFFHNNNVVKVVFAGGVKRPNFNQLSMDTTGASWLAKLGKNIFFGDDTLLRSIAHLLESEGFELISGADLLNDVFLSIELATTTIPSDADYKDIACGFHIAKSIGELDVGQAVVVDQGLILGIECVEGTDQLIERCASLRKSPKGGVLVKVAKPQQSLKMDLPTIGEKTIENLHKYGFSGVAVEAQKCILVNKQSVIERANELGIFLIGVDGESLASNQ